MVVDRDMVWLGWQERALCETEEAQAYGSSFTNEDGSPTTLLELFYPLPTDKDPKKRITAIRALCDQCPVKKQCQDYAISTNEPDGIWGGLTRSDRDKIRKAGK